MKLDKKIMKKIILIMLVFLLVVFGINADTCSFLDSNGDCVTTVTELDDARNMASLKGINCAWSDCTLTLDANGDSYVDMLDVKIIRDITVLKTPSIDGAPSVLTLSLINDNTQIKISVTDSDGTPRSDIGVNYEVVENPLAYNGVSYTDSNGEFIVEIPAELLTQTFTAKAWFDADATKQIPYTESIMPYSPPLFCNALTQCFDGVDNDGDGMIDAADLGCWNGAYDMGDNDETNNGGFQCNDGVDNDLDGKVDWPFDSDCKSPIDNDESSPAPVAAPQCSDGVDNDGDNYIDYLDLGCYNNGWYDPNDNSEVPQCSDNVDNDGDGEIDLADYSCTDATDNTENIGVAQCGDNLDNDLDGLFDQDDLGCENANDISEYGVSEAGEFVADANTIALYHFNELSGSSVADSSGNGLHGTAVGTTIVDGVFGKARNFDGVSGDYVGFLTSNLFDVSGDLTLEAYINWNGPNNAEIVGKTGLGGTSYRLLIDVSKLTLLAYGGGVRYDCISTRNIPVAQVVHVAGTINTVTQTMQVFIDGKLENTCSGPASIDLSSTGVRIGARSFTPIDDLMRGMIDEVRISNIVRY